MNSIKFSKKYLIIVLLIVLSCAFSVLFYNQKKAKAQETVICDTEIPIGESMDKTYELLIDLIEEHQKVYEAIWEQTEQAKETVKLIEECDTRTKAEKNCKPCCNSTLSLLGLPICIPLKCISVFWGICLEGVPLKTNNRALHADDVCPTKDIKETWDKQKKFAFSEKDKKDETPSPGDEIKKPKKDKSPPTNGSTGEEDSEKNVVIDGVIGSAGNITALIQGENTLDLEVKGKYTRECLDKDNDCEEKIDKKVEIEEDIRLEGEPKNKKITRIEFINRKLGRAREKFKGCALTPLEISALQIGEEWPRTTTHTVTVAQERYQLPERVKDECQEACGEDSDRMF